MKKIPLFFLLAAACTTVRAQLTLSDCRMRPGDRLVKYQVAFKDPGPAGADLLWDFKN